jgi:hypothetical protein
MPLSNDETLRVRTWFSEHGLHLCFCERGVDEPADLSPHLFVLSAAEGPETLPVVAVTCPSCGYISFYNGKTLGVVE